MVPANSIRARAHEQIDRLLDVLGETPATYRYAVASCNPQGMMDRLERLTILVLRQSLELTKVNRALTRKNRTIAALKQRVRDLEVAQKAIDYAIWDK